MILAEGLPSDPVGRSIPASISADCSRDVTREINAWISSVPDNSTLVFRRDGCYRIERTILVEDRVGLVFEGNRATFKRFEVSPPELQYPEANAHMADRRRPNHHGSQPRGARNQYRAR